MKKFLRLMTVSALALVMALSLASCALFNKIEIGDVEDAMEDLVDEDDEKYQIAEVDGDMEDALVAAFESLFGIKGGIEGAAELYDIEDEDTPWVMAVEFEKAADAKKVAKDLEDSIVDLMIEISAASYEAYLEEMGMDSDEIKETMKEWKKEAADEIEETLPKDFVVERKGNVVFCGDEGLIETVLEAFEDAKK